MSFKEGDLHIEVERLRAENHELRELVRDMVTLHAWTLPRNMRQYDEREALRESVNRRIMAVGL